MNTNLYKNIIRKKGMTQNQIAEKTGLSRAFISQIEHGISKPSKDSEFKIAEALGVTVNELYLPTKEADTSRLIELLIDCTIKRRIQWQELENIRAVKTERTFRAKSNTEQSVGEITAIIKNDFLTILLKDPSCAPEKEKIILRCDDELMQVPMLIEIMTRRNNPFIQKIINDLKEIAKED